MTREELLKQLHKTKFCAVPTVQTYDMGLEYDFVDESGAGTSIGSFGSWPLYKLCTLSEEKLAEIKTKLQTATITEDDISCTDIGLIFERCGWNENVTLAKFLDTIKTIEKQQEEYLYCFCDVSDYYPEALFYETKQELLDYFHEHYCYEITAWEEFDDEELENWLERIQNGDLDENCFWNLCYEEEEND